MAGYNLKSEEEVKEYLDNLGKEYRFLCFHEKKPEGCHLLGDYLEAAKLDFKKAAKIYKSNCDDYQFGNSCFKFGNYSYLGKGCEENFLSAFEYYKKGCELQNYDACFHCGLLLTTADKRNKGLDKDFTEGIKYLTKGCVGGNATSCYFASGLYISGAEGIQKDLSKAFELTSKACDLGNMFACVNLSHMYKKGDGVEKDEKMAIVYKDKVTEMRNQLKKRGIEFQQYVQ